MDPPKDSALQESWWMNIPVIFFPSNPIQREYSVFLIVVLVFWPHVCHGTYMVPGYIIYMDNMCIMVPMDTKIYGIYGLYVYIDASIFCLWLWICMFVKVFSFNILGIFKNSMGSLISPFSQGALIKWQWGCSFTFTGANACKQGRCLPWAILCRDDKALAAVRSA